MHDLKWDKRFLQEAINISTYSKDPSTQVGAIIVKDRHIISTGYNGFPKGIEDTEDRLNNRDIKYKYVVHAEVNAILQCAIHGTSTNQSTIYTFPLAPCSECTKFIITAGIKRIVYPSLPQHLTERWKNNLDFAKLLAAEAGIELVEISL